MRTKIFALVAAAAIAAVVIVLWPRSSRGPAGGAAHDSPGMAESDGAGQDRGPRARRGDAAANGPVPRSRPLTLAREGRRADSKAVQDARADIIERWQRFVGEAELSEAQIAEVLSLLYDAQLEVDAIRAERQKLILVVGPPMDGESEEEYLARTGLASEGPYSLTVLEGLDASVAQFLDDRQRTLYHQRFRPFVPALLSARMVQPAPE